MGEVHMQLSSTQSIKIEQPTKWTLKTATGLSWLQAMHASQVTGDVQHHDGKRTETGNGHHIGIVIQLYCNCYIMLMLWFQYIAVSLCYIKILCNIKRLQVSKFGIKTSNSSHVKYLKEPDQRALDSWQPAKAYALRKNRKQPFKVNKQIKNIINHSLLKPNFLKAHQVPDQTNNPFPGTIHQVRREESWQRGDSGTVRCTMAQ